MHKETQKRLQHTEQQLRMCKVHTCNSADKFNLIQFERTSIQFNTV